MTYSIFEKIKSFILKETGVKEKKITIDARLEIDLGISGDDAVDFILAFGKEFGVDLSQFKIQKYFYPEGDALLPDLIRMVTGQKEAKQKDLTIKNLLDAVEVGRLNDEIIGN